MPRLISIPESVQEGSYTIYKIHTKLPLRTIASEKRYSDFVTLREALERETNPAFGAIPYALPSKTVLGWRKNAALVTAERRVGLGNWLNDLWEDPRYCNLVSLKEFLRVPLTHDPHQSQLREPSQTKGWGASRAVDPRCVTADEWLACLKEARVLLGDTKRARRQGNALEALRLSLNVTKQAGLLRSVLTRHEDSAIIAPMEVARRWALVRELEVEAESSTPLTTAPIQPPLVPTGKARVFGGGSTTTKSGETAQTIPHSNQVLLQMHTLVKEEQDKELGALQMLVSKQRTMAVAINEEIAQQTEILDELDEGLTRTETKLKYARKKTTQFL